MRLESVCVLSAVWVLVAVTWLPAVDLYVAPDGNDAWSGSLDRPNGDGTDGPLASLAGARDAVRRLEITEAFGEPVRVIFADGVYPVTEPVVFEPADSGTGMQPVRYEAAQGARPAIDGGIRITGFVRGDDGVWTADVPAIREGRPRFEQLFINGTRAVRARTPNDGYFYMSDYVDNGIDPTTGKPADLSHRMFVARPGDMKAWPDLKDAMLIIFESWETVRTHVADFDPETNRVLLTTGTAWRLFQWGGSQRYFVENIAEALDAPGEWFLGRDGKLSYIPRPGEDMTTAEVVAPIAESFVQIKGDAPKGRFVENITFSGLTFRYADHVLGDKDAKGLQAASQVPAVIQANGARHITIEDCEIAHIAPYAVWLRHGCQDCTLQRTYIHDLGAGGVRLGEAHMRDNPDERTCNNVIDNNIIRDGGHIYPAGVGIWIAQSGDNRITHNEIADLYYTGISVGWRWGYAATQSIRNVIDSNHIHHIGQGVLSDMGAVYTLGPAPGTVISNNVCHDIIAYHYGGWGLYNDEGTSYMLLENNLVYNTKTGGYHQHYGRENVIRNNIFAFAMKDQLQRTRIEPHTSFTFAHNIVIYDQGTLLGTNWTGENIDAHDNLYWNTAGPVVFRDGKDIAAWQAAGNDAGSIVADPMFEDAPARDFTLKPGSPAGKIGFEPFDFGRAGVYGQRDWIELAGSVSYPPVELVTPPPPGPLSLNEGFEFVEVGKTPSQGRAVVENKGDSLPVTNEAAAAGAHSLRFVDVPGLAHEFYPMLVYSPNHSSGRTRCSFDVLVSKDAYLYHDWRDSHGEYRSGPFLAIRDGNLELPDRAPVPLPNGRWLHFEIATQLGQASPGTWDLVVSVLDPASTQPAVQGADAKGVAANPAKYRGLLRHDDLSYVSEGFDKLLWLGFVSNGRRHARIYLDNLVLINE